MTEDRETREMLLRMIIRCNKVRKHKPKKVKSPVLKISSIPSEEFPDQEIQGNYYTFKSKGVRQSLRNLAQKD